MRKPYPQHLDCLGFKINLRPVGFQAAFEFSTVREADGSLARS
jgi:hypothetical protein